jgi:hypothetical protein
MVADMVADIAAVTRWRIMVAGMVHAMQRRIMAVGALLATRQVTMVTDAGQRMRHMHTPAGTKTGT